MALLFSPLSLVPSKSTPTSLLRLSPPLSLSFRLSPKPHKFPSFVALSGAGPPEGVSDDWGEKGSDPGPDPVTKLADSDPPVDDDEWGGVGAQNECATTGSGSKSPVAGVSDEWGEKGSGPEAKPTTKLADSDPPVDEDEWGGVGVRDEDATGGYSSKAPEMEDNGELEGLKRCLVDTVYGSDLGLRASSEVRAEVLELVNQLEAVNPTPAPTEATEVLEGNWVLVYTAFSELLPLLALGTAPFLKVKRISQAINISTSTIDNSVTLTSPFASFSFSASANFAVQTPSRIEVEFKEGSFQPPEIKTSIDLPENVNIFGQAINLSPVRQSLTPLQDAVATIARTISGQPPLKLPIPGERTKSWLLTTYLDNDLRISRGDGGIFVLVKEGSPLLEQ